MRFKKPYLHKIILTWQVWEVSRGYGSLHLATEILRFQLAQHLGFPVSSSRLVCQVTPRQPQRHSANGHGSPSSGKTHHRKISTSGYDFHELILFKNHRTWTIQSITTWVSNIFTKISNIENAKNIQQSPNISPLTTDFWLELLAEKISCSTTPPMSCSMRRRTSPSKSCATSFSVISFSVCRIQKAIHEKVQQKYPACYVKLYVI